MYVFIKIQGALLQQCFHFKQVFPKALPKMCDVPQVPSSPCHSQSLARSPLAHRMAVNSSTLSHRQHQAVNDALSPKHVF